MLSASSTSAESAVRLARSEDISALHDIRTASVRCLCCRSYTRELIDAWLSSSNPDFSASIRAGRLFVAEQAQRIVGFTEAASGTVLRLYVHPSAAGRGVGAILLARALAVASLGSVQTVRVESTLNAQSFYKRFGFRTIEQATVQCNGHPFPILHMERACA